MSTRGRIAIQLPDESILSVYCHSDNYPKGTGVNLLEHFSNREDVEELIDGGDISCLWTNVGWNNETLSETGPLYYSSRGEECPPHHDNNLEEYLSEGEQYAYIFTLEDEWVCYNMHQFDDSKSPEIVEIPDSVTV